MLQPRMNIILTIGLLVAGAVQSFAQTVPPKEDEAKLIAALKSDDASHKEKVDACRGLALIGTSKAIAPLASLLGDEKLSHMARYALEPIPDPAVDKVLRDALGKLKGKPLVGVIGSIGVRRDARAVRPLTKMLQDADVEVAQAAARALGRIANQRATRALQRALGNAAASNQLALCEGLFRCAEAHAAEGRREVAVEIYDQLLELDAPHQVRGGALRGAILARGKDGVALLQQNLKSEDYILFSAACQTALEMPGSEVTQALTAEVNRLPADNQILVIWTLGKRADPAALPALFALAKKGNKSVRSEAIRALPQIGDASATPVLVELLADADGDISKAAKEGLAALPGRQVDTAIMRMLNSSQANQRLTALELIGRRRMASSIRELIEAAGDDDTKVRQAALKMVGELGSPSNVSEVLDLLMGFKESRDLSAAEQAVAALCMKDNNPQSYTGKLAGLLARAKPPQKGTLLRILGVIGGTNALEAVRGVVDDPNADVRAAAIRVLCGWKTADAAPDLLALAKTSPNASQKTAALVGYINLVRDVSLPTEKKLVMCKEAASLIQRNQEKKLLLGVLAMVPAAEALSMAMAHLDNPETKDEACLAAVAISEKIVQEKPGEVADALKKVMRATDNRNVTRRARATLNKAKEAAEK